ncbi:MAG TPA: DnaA/Hda family protein [Gemmatimonadaceae bacterium]|nr:DnaA/Hda family protein [Gemmatimonadaceae bacterium]
MELDARYRFENYVVGSANRLAVSAARAVAQAPGAAFNPLFIYSGSGLGKTHLLLAIGHLGRQLQPDLKVAYNTVDELVDELNASVASSAVDALRERYQNVNVLLLDDVQFLAGRRETQSEILRLFNGLQRGGRQIVLTSDRPPAEISDLDDRLITRFSGGLVVDVGAPDYETRAAIARLKSDERGAQFDTGVLDEVARIPFGNVRELQGALNRLIACQTLGERAVTALNVRELLGERPEVADAPTAVASNGHSPRGGEFSTFLSDLSAVVAQQIEPWRIRLLEVMSRWREEGFLTAAIERALEGSEEPDVEATVRQFESAVARLQSLAREAEALDPSLASSDLFRDPERVGEVELAVARLLGAAEPPPGPSPDYVRADFEVGPSNQLAVHAADTVIEEPGKKYNPLVVYGPSGVGKTHLLNALGNELIGLRGGATTVACVSARHFTEELIAALREGTIERWRARYRVVDVLIIDDVHECAGTERTQEELFHIFNALYASGRQIVLSMRCAPKSIEGLEDRLRSRFEGGLVVEMQAPDHVLRERLYARSLSAADVRHDRALIDYLASRAVASVAEIMATVQRLVQAADVVGIPLTANFARKELEGRVAAPAVAHNGNGHPADPLFLDEEKVIWDWPDVSGRAIEEFR